MDRARRGLVPLSLVACVLAAFAPAPSWGQPSPGVTDAGLELRPGATRIVYEREKGTDIYVDLGIHVASPDAPFEIRLQRDDYADEIDVWQVLRGPGVSQQERPLPQDVMAGWYGLDDFFAVTIRNRDGEVVTELATDFCPNAYDAQRVNDAGPQTPTYPSTCGANPFTKGMVWGIDEGWAVRIIETADHPIRLRAGLYRVTVAITPRYIELFSLDPATATTEVELRVKTVDYGFPPATGSGPESPEEADPTDAPIVEPPDPATLPDLVPLPAWDMSLQHGRRKTRLNFSATVSVQGASPLVVEGYRRQTEDVMDAYQYFYSGDEVIGRAPVGILLFDRRDGHFHWHFQQFARYSLIDADGEEILISQKEAFCLASTDAIDLLLPGVGWRPDNSDLSTACGSQDSLWVREILPLGWADTYSQTLPGQSFDITDLPNGKYFVSVAANPEGLLHEQSLDNNVELREIYLRGRDKDRRVVVPPWNGIDTENSGTGEGDHLHP